VVIGAGLGGLASAMRLGARGYDVTLIDRLDVPGGRGSAMHGENGHRFDLGPTIVTVPQVLSQALGRLRARFRQGRGRSRALDPYYEIRWPDGSRFQASGDHRPDARRGGTALAGRCVGLSKRSSKTARRATGSGSRISAGGR
jgi:phytoene desaturase